LLIDSEALQFEAYARVLERYGVAVTRAEYAAQWIAAGRGPEYAVLAYRLPLSAYELRALKDPVYHEIMRERIALMPGALAALQRVHGHYPLGLATNSNRADTRFVLGHLGLRRFFQVVVTRDQYARAKPEPDAYVVAAARLGRAPQHCVVVEDSHRGIVAASRAGAMPIAVPNDFTRDNDFSLAAAVLDRLDGLTVGLIEDLLAQRGIDG
jgi:HAD superfamily hydrolase (TIGR01509 family)